MRHQVLDYTRASWAALLILVGPWAGYAQSNEIPEITITGQRGYPLVLTQLEGAAGAMAAPALKGDLQRSGAFRFVQAVEGAFIVQGHAVDGRLEGRVLDPENKVLLNRAYQSAPMDQLVHRFADDIVLAISGKPGIAASQIVFVSNSTGKKELFISDCDGRNVRQITRDNSISVSPSLSPDRTRLVYTSYLNGFADIYLIDLASGKRDRIISQPGTNTGATFSPSGDRLALTMSFPGNPELFVTGLNGGNAKRLTRSKSVESSPAWSPDGKRLIYVSDASGRPQLYLTDAGGSRPEPLSTGYAYCVEPDWSPDGNRIAFNVRENGVFNVAIHDFQNKVTKTLTSGSNAEGPVWGADSRHLIYVQENSIYLHDTESGRRERIVNNLGQISELAWSR